MAFDTTKIIIHANEFHGYFDTAAEITLNKILGAITGNAPGAGIHYFKIILENFNGRLYDRLFLNEGDVLFTITTYQTLMRTAFELCIEEDIENRDLVAFPEDVLDGLFSARMQMIREASKAILNDKT
mgnify:CR=1 FL=1